jgi:hypothetical protein
MADDVPHSSNDARRSQNSPARDGVNQSSFAIFSTVFQSTIGVSRRSAMAPLGNPLPNGVKVSEWSWMSSMRMTFDSSFENHGPALSVYSRRNPLVMLFVHALSNRLKSSSLAMLK